MEKINHSFRQEKSIFVPYCGNCFTRYDDKVPKWDNRTANRKWNWNDKKTMQLKTALNSSLWNIYYCCCCLFFLFFPAMHDGQDKHILYRELRSKYVDLANHILLQILYCNIIIVAIAFLPILSFNEIWQWRKVCICMWRALSCESRNTNLRSHDKNATEEIFSLTCIRMGREQAV